MLMHCHQDLPARILAQPAHRLSYVPEHSSDLVIVQRPDADFTRPGARKQTTSVRREQEEIVIGSQLE